RRRRSQPGLQPRRRGRRQQPLTIPSEGRGADQVTGRRLTGSYARVNSASRCQGSPAQVAPGTPDRRPPPRVVVVGALLRAHRELVGERVRHRHPLDAPDELRLLLDDHSFRPWTRGPYSWRWKRVVVEIPSRVAFMRNAPPVLIRPARTQALGEKLLP